MKKLFALLFLIAACNSSPVGPSAISSAVTPPEETVPEPVCVEWGWGVKQTPVGPMEIIVCKRWDNGS